MQCSSGSVAYSWSFRAWVCQTVLIVLNFSALLFTELDSTGVWSLDCNKPGVNSHSSWVVYRFRRRGAIPETHIQLLKILLLSVSSPPPLSPPIMRTSPPLPLLPRVVIEPQVILSHPHLGKEWRVTSAVKKCVECAMDRVVCILYPKLDTRIAVRPSSFVLRNAQGTPPPPPPFLT